MDSVADIAAMSHVVERAAAVDPYSDEEEAVYGKGSPIVRRKMEVSTTDTWVHDAVVSLLRKMHPLLERVPFSSDMYPARSESSDRERLDMFMMEYVRGVDGKSRWTVRQNYYMIRCMEYIMMRCQDAYYGVTVGSSYDLYVMRRVDHYRKVLYKDVMDGIRNDLDVRASSKGAMTTTSQFDMGRLRTVEHYLNTVEQAYMTTHMDMLQQNLATPSRLLTRVDPKSGMMRYAIAPGPPDDIGFVYVDDAIADFLLVRAFSFAEKVTVTEDAGRRKKGWFDQYPRLWGKTKFERIEAPFRENVIVIDLRGHCVSRDGIESIARQRYSFPRLKVLDLSNNWKYKQIFETSRQAATDQSLKKRFTASLHYEEVSSYDIMKNADDPATVIGDSVFNLLRSFDATNELSILRLDTLNICRFPPSYLNLSRLQELSLRNNLIARLPEVNDSVAPFPDLRRLDISNNPLDIPDSGPEFQRFWSFIVAQRSTLDELVMQNLTETLTLSKAFDLLHLLFSRRRMRRLVTLDFSVTVINPKDSHDGFLRSGWYIIDGNSTDAPSGNVRPARIRDELKKIEVDGRLFRAGVSFETLDSILLGAYLVFVFRLLLNHIVDSSSDHGQLYSFDAGEFDNYRLRLPPIRVMEGNSMADAYTQRGSTYSRLISQRDTHEHVHNEIGHNISDWTKAIGWKRVQNRWNTVNETKKLRYDLASGDRKRKYATLWIDIGRLSRELPPTVKPRPEEKMKTNDFLEDLMGDAESVSRLAYIPSRLLDPPLGQISIVRSRQVRLADAAPPFEDGCLASRLFQGTGKTDSFLTTLFSNEQALRDVVLRGRYADESFEDDRSRNTLWHMRHAALNLLTGSTRPPPTELSQDLCTMMTKKMWQVVDMSRVISETDKELSGYTPSYRHKGASHYMRCECEYAMIKSYGSFLFDETLLREAQKNEMLCDPQWRANDSQIVFNPVLLARIAHMDHVIESLDEWMRTTHFVPANDPIVQMIIKGSSACVKRFSTQNTMSADSYDNGTYDPNILEKWLEALVSIHQMSPDYTSSADEYTDGMEGHYASELNYLLPADTESKAADSLLMIAIADVARDMCPFLPPKHYVMHGDGPVAQECCRAYAARLMTLCRLCFVLGVDGRWPVREEGVAPAAIVPSASAPELGLAFSDAEVETQVKTRFAETMDSFLFGSEDGHERMGVARIHQAILSKIHTYTFVAQQVMFHSLFSIVALRPSSTPMTQDLFKVSRSAHLRTNESTLYKNEPLEKWMADAQKVANTTTYLADYVRDDKLLDDQLAHADGSNSVELSIAQQAMVRHAKEIAFDRCRLACIDGIMRVPCPYIVNIFGRMRVPHTPRATYRQVGMSSQRPSRPKGAQSLKRLATIASPRRRAQPTESAKKMQPPVASAPRTPSPRKRVKSPDRETATKRPPSAAALSTPTDLPVSPTPTTGSIIGKFDPDTGAPIISLVGAPMRPHP